jgi:hypothetical protein
MQKPMEPPYRNIPHDLFYLAKKSEVENIAPPGCTNSGKHIRKEKGKRGAIFVLSLL